MSVQAYQQVSCLSSNDCKRAAVAPDVLCSRQHEGGKAAYFHFKNKLNICHLFLILAVLGLHCCVGALSGCSVRASHGDFSSGAQVLGHAYGLQ